jgi:hypothetical protein
VEAENGGRTAPLPNGYDLNSANKTFHVLPNPLADLRWGHRTTVFWDNSAPLAGGSTDDFRRIRDRSRA